MIRIIDPVNIAIKASERKKRPEIQESLSEPIPFTPFNFESHFFLRNFAYNRIT
jgi:hypothetical protein